MVLLCRATTRFPPNVQTKRSHFQSPQNEFNKISTLLKPVVAGFSYIMLAAGMDFVEPSARRLLEAYLEQKDLHRQLSFIAVSWSGFIVQLEGSCD